MSENAHRYQKMLESVNCNLCGADDFEVVYEKIPNTKIKDKNVDFSLGNFYMINMGFTYDNRSGMNKAKKLIRQFNRQYEDLMSFDVVKEEKI